VLNELVYGVRLLRRNPAYSSIVIAVVAVGIAANLIAFGLFKALALTPLAGVASSGWLQYIGSRSSSGQILPLSYPDYADIRDRAFPGLAAWGIQPLVLTHRDSSRLVSTEFISRNYFDVLQTHVQIGRAIGVADSAVPGMAPIAVLSDGLWRRAFGADPHVVGTTIRINHQPLTVIGISARDFHGAVVGLAADLFVPMTMHDAVTGERWLAARDDHWVHAFMRPPGDRAQADARAAQVGRTLASEYPIDTLSERAAIVPIWQWPFGAQSYLLPAVGLMGVMAVLLLVVVSANVAGLVLVRSLSRQGETAARLALGASRSRIIRQLLVESLVLAVPAAMIGFVLPGFLQSFLGAAAANVSLPLFFNTEPDGFVIAVAAALAAASALIYGVVPALRLSRVEPSAVLKDEMHPGGGGTGRLRALLVVAQVAVALVMLVGTALILRTLDAAQHADAGFDPSHVTWASFDARAGGYDETRGRAVYTQLLDAVRGDPDVANASFAAFLPLSLIDWMNWNAVPEGYERRRDDSMGFAVNVVSPGYFATLRIPLLAGRDFDATDTPSGSPRLIVNETFARRFWGTPARAIGHVVDTQGGRRTVVGVVRDIKYARLDEPSRPYMYVPAAQQYSASMTLQVRGGDAAAVLARIRARAQAIDPSLVILQSGVMADTVRSATSVYETLARVLSVVGALAVAVAALGVYGLMAYSVKQKAHDIGIRAALGAPRARIVRHFLRHGALLTVSGAGLGVLAALIVSRLMRSMLFGVAATDIVAFGGAVFVVITAALVASWLPAWRAANADPVTALRHQ
jgi:predicted permease